MKFMKLLRQEKVNSLLKNLAASFLSKKTADVLITITRIETSKDLKSAKIFISIFPENKEKETLIWLNGEKNELRKFIGSQIKMKFLPSLEFEIDKEERSRKRIEELLKMGS